MKFATKVIHAGIEPDPSTGAIMTPIYQTSTYVQAAPGDHKGYEYARTQNPTRSALEKNIAALEGAKFGFAFASGMSAIDTALKLVKGGFDFGGRPAFLVHLGDAFFQIDSRLQRAQNFIAGAKDPIEKTKLL